MSKISSGYWVVRPIQPSIPALLKKASIPPKRSFAVHTYRSTSLDFDTSAGTPTRAGARGVNECDDFVQRAPGEVHRDDSRPSRANRSAAALPIPPAAPVMTTTLPSNLRSMDGTPIPG
ncbi:hypothetical protein [Candidatus Amarobacter glycogenicus]|uniref:hypothetical protein n=1 Tax=Candidatus Amarobacter glycogenicus TaxID=3140699 RepID=UPI0031CC5EC2